MKLPKPSLYQIFLVSMGLLLVFFLLSPSLFAPDDDGTKLKIGIVDSGCRLSHRSDIVEYSSFTTIEYGYPYDDKSLYDTTPNGHGKYVCDIIIDGTDDVSIYSARIANGNGYVTYEGLFAAVEYLVNEKDVDIINLSLGGEPYFSSDLFEAFEDVANEKIFIAATGNAANDHTYPEGIVDWPATLPWVIGVGSDDTNGGRAYYSSYGRSNTGIFATEYVNNGVIETSSGTSFATPRVTVEFANLWKRLMSEGNVPKPEVLNYLMANATMKSFSPEIGWGVPNYEDVTYSDGILFHGTDEIDPLHKFQEETWSMNWKVTGTLDEYSPVLSGNGTDLISNSSVTDYSWGDILSIDFQASTIHNGNYTVNISHPKGNSFSYSFVVKNQTANQKVLLDHRNTPNGFSHRWGQYFRLESSLRSDNIQVDQIQNGPIDLTDYDMVMVTEFGKREALDKLFDREYNRSYIDEYYNYASNGGKLQIFSTYPDNFSFDTEYDEALLRFGAVIGNTRIPIDTKQEIIYTSDLLVDPIFSGVNSIGVSGSAISSLNSSQTELGHYTASEAGVSQTYSIGIRTQIDFGTVYIWSGTKMLSNDFFIDGEINYDRFLSNYLSS